MRKTDKSLKVVFVDDNDDFLKSWRATFKRGAPRTGLTLLDNDRGATKNAVLALDRARLQARKTKRVIPVDEAALFNDADLVFVDYDLIELEGTTALTGEDIAYLLRCFTSCGFIVLLNPPDLGTNFFDLRLRRSMDSWADLVLGSDQLDNTWLWTTEPSGFAPWQWPRLSDAAARRSQQVNGLREALDIPVLDILELPESARVAMDHAMRDPVSHRVSGAARGSATRESYTLRDFVLKSGYGVHRKDNEEKQFEDAAEHIARIGAARLSSWLEHVVLPAQSLLVDAPHLVTRLPRLIAGEPSKLATWNVTATRDGNNAARGIRETEIKRHRFVAEHWLSRPAWYWPGIAGDERYIEWAAADKMADVVFCEDTSSFARRSDAHEFMADVPAQFALRYVRKPSPRRKRGTPEYRPSVRLSM